MQFEKYKGSLGLKNKIGRFIWNLVWILLFRTLGLPLFNGWRIFLLRLFGAKIGRGCKINASAKVWAPWNLQLGDLVAIGFDVLCYNPGRISIGNKVAISQRSHLCSASHDITLASHPLVTAPIIIRDRAWIATDVFVGPGVTIGEGAVLGARSCVFKNVEPWAVMGGNPAKFLKKREIIG